MIDNLTPWIEAVAQPVSWALVHSFWQGGIVAFILAVVLALGKLVEMKIHNVTPSFIRMLEKRGLSDVSARRLIELKIHGVY